MIARLAGTMITVAIAAAAVTTLISMPITRTSAQVPALKTPWGESDLQGIWTDEFDTPLQRSAKYATQEFFTAIQREELDKQRAAHYSSSDSRRERGTVKDVNGTDNNTVFLAKIGR